MMKMRMSFESRVGRFWLNVGWYTPEPQRLFGFIIGERIEGFPDPKWYKDFWTIFEIRVWGLTFAFGLSEQE